MIINESEILSLLSVTIFLIARIFNVETKDEAKGNLLVLKKSYFHRPKAYLSLWNYIIAQ
jgi:hypothetical protein